jgi:hypothetical protein
VLTIKFIAVIVTALVFAVAMVLALLYWLRIVRSMWLVWAHVMPEALEKYWIIKINRLNAIFYSGTLDSVGAAARIDLYKNVLKFVGVIGVGMLCGILSELLSGAAI